MPRNYVILTAAEAADINYDQVCESYEDNLRWNNDNTKTFVKWESGDPTPDICIDKPILSHSEIINILRSNDGEW